MVQLKPFSVGDVVLVDGPPGEVVGEVLHAMTIDELPDCGLGSMSKLAKNMMRAIPVDLVLLVGHQHGDRDVCFCALHTPEGWMDVQGQRLAVLKGYPGSRTRRSYERGN
jgi:hypothetical protein